MKFVLVSMLVLTAAALPAQTVAHAKGVVHTEDVDLGYETLGR